MDLELAKEYRQALEGASRRSRWVILTMASASIIVFSAAWNMWSFNWLEQRISVCRDALETRAWEAPGPTLTDPEYRAKFERGRRYLRVTRMQTESEIVERLKQLQDVKFEHILRIRVPVLGVTFDCNDLDLIASLSFTVLLLMCRHSLYAEHRCLRKARHAPGASYELLSLTQVLNVPEETSRVWRWAPKILFLLPVSVQLMLLLVDLDTLDLGEAISIVHTRAMIATDAVLLILNVTLTLACLRLSQQMDEVWSATARTT